MRYEKGHKDETRQHIIDVAAKRFRETGVAAAGVAGLMADAGLTNGAFYTHFESKEDLVRAALLKGLERRKQGLAAAAENGTGPEEWIRTYLSPRHRDNPGSGCAASALTAEIARHPKATRDVFTTRLAEIIDLIARQLPGDSSDTRRRTGIALYGMMIGTLQLARAVSDEDLSAEILESGLSAALALIGKDETREAPSP